MYDREDIQPYFLNNLRVYLKTHSGLTVTGFIQVIDGDTFQVKDKYNELVTISYDDLKIIKQARQEAE